MDLKKNFLYSGILTVSDYFFPLLIYPYISRVLGVENIGICNFVDSIINYFILFSMLGINVVGIREIASVKDNAIKLNKTFSSLFILTAITTFISSIALIICIFYISELIPYRRLLLLGLIKLIGNFFLIEWFYKGVENFKYITNRTIFVKICYTGAIFLFIKQQTDYDIYILLTALMVAVNSIFNCFYARHFLNFTVHGIILKKFIKPILILGMQLFLTSMYTSVNVAYLGFISTKAEVGYYATATKLYAVVISLYQAYTGVLLPRMSYLISNNEKQKFLSLIYQSIEILFACSIPVVIFSVIFSPEIIMLISGPGYAGAVTPARIVFPLILIIGYDQIMMIQILMPLKKDKALFVCSIIGAITGIIMNLLLVPYYKSIGSAIVWLVSEIVVVSVSQYYVRNFIGKGFPIKQFMSNILSYIPLIIILGVFCYYNTFGYILKLTFGALFTFIYFIFIQRFFLKNGIVLSSFSKIFKWRLIFF